MSDVQPLPAPIVADLPTCVVCDKPLPDDDSVVFVSEVCSFRCDDVLAEYELGLL